MILFPMRFNYAFDIYLPTDSAEEPCFLKNESNLTDRQALKLEELLQYDLKSVRAYLLKESFQGFWQYSSPYWAERFLRLWCARAMRSKLEPMKKFVKTVRRLIFPRFHGHIVKHSFSIHTASGSDYQ